MTGGYDYAVVGAGIVGLACARELQRRHPQASVVVVDRADRVAAGQSGHNSGVIHAGVYYRPGSLKARLCAGGAARLYEYCLEQGIEARRVGKLIVATRTEELPRLEEIERRARSNGVAGLRRLSREEISEIEPHATGVAALHSPPTGIVDFTAVSRHLAAEVQDAGGELRLGWPVSGLTERSGDVVLRSGHGEALSASAAIFCAGLQADRLAGAAGGEANPRIVPFRGTYLRLRPAARNLVRGLIYPVPDPALPFLGIHLTPQISGQVLVGPSAMLLPTPHGLSWLGSWRMMRRWWRTGATELHLASSRRAFAAAAQRYVPELTAADLEPARAGIRAQAVGRDGSLVDDFVLTQTGRTVHVRNAPSPAATSSLALAGVIVERLEQHQR